MSALFRFFSLWPLGLLHALGAALGWLSFLLSPLYRRRFLANAARAGYGFAQVRAAVAHAGRMTAELPRLWLGAAPRLEWEGEACLEAAYAAGRGVVFLTPHMGCFEVCAQAVGARYAAQHGALTVLYRPARQPWLAELMAGARRRPGLETAPTTLAGVRQMLKALRAGRAVGLLPDQVPPEGLGLWAPFFGQPAYTMTLGARLALQTGAAVLLVWGERLPWGRGFRLHFSELRQPLAEPLEAAVQQINQEMERLIRECPQQYLWGYARYKQPRKEG
ncbi:lysophospholipid acyltransferase family protein [Ramlibacter sp. 2FC]|uniref:lysophospholipid acyltransferase family protein n=1 Tax=Ramlibacter sp. 2FC TaxID=2502188 RepID=UPI0010F6DCE1|nr:lysophospholipid acyltransferase family protein [Ramlibacter sp. 2FC]